MSRILRRPMFRGGPVDSYGTGIASGLAEGGRVGYNRGAFVVQPPGAQGKSIFSIQDILSQAGAPMTGKQILEYAQNKQMNLGRDFKINPYTQYQPESIEQTTSEGDTYEKSWSDIINEKGSWEDVPKYEDPNEVYVGSEDKQGTIEVLDTVNVKLDEKGNVVKDELGNPIYTGNQGEIKQTLEVKEEPKGEVIISNSSDTDASTVSETDLDSMISRYENLLGMKKARVQDASDWALKFFANTQKEGATVGSAAGETADWISSKPSRTEKIKQAAAMLGIKGDQAIKLYETKLKNQSGQLQKAVEYIKDINPGMTDKEALATYQRRPRSLAETVGKYKKQDGAIMPSGITLAAGEWFLDDYQGELPTDGNIKQGDAAKGKKDGAYTDKAKGLIFVIKDEIVTDVSKFEN